ncbi:MAG TPA: exodeoxyribonuclease III, partial [Phenylobacterium sp.]|nr:exodeoxyribonuclease III [Phenylobacterium sp.]
MKARLPRLLEWLEETQPDIACLQEIKTQDEGFPVAEFEKLGYGAIWHGQKSFNGVAILAKGAQPAEVRRGLAGEPEDDHSRYLEADVAGVRVACIYLPNGNPQPGPKFDYKLRWMERLRRRMAEIWAEHVPALITGD